MTVRYSFGRLLSGRVVHIADYAGDEPVHCVGCCAPLTARRGRIRAWHFAHANTVCVPETVLHATAKELIAQAINDAKANGGQYEIRWRCPACGSRRKVDCMAFVEGAQLEAEGVPGVVSDVWVQGRPFVIEVVVTHHLEEVAIQRYLSAGVAVFTVEPTWEVIESLSRGIDATRVIGANTNGCDGCAARRRARSVWETTSRQIRESLVGVSPTTQAVLREWSHDARGNELFSHARERVHREALKILRAGFLQCRRKPWLFRRPLPGRMGVLFLNLGGTEEVPIWEDWNPLLHGQVAGPEWVKAIAFREVERHLEPYGVEPRYSFHETACWSDDAELFESAIVDAKQRARVRSA